MRCALVGRGFPEPPPPLLGRMLAPCFSAVFRYFMRGYVTPLAGVAPTVGAAAMGPQLPMAVAAGGPVAPPAAPLLAPLAPPGGAGGFGRAVSGYAGRFYRLPPGGFNGGWGFQPTQRALEGCLAGSWALDPCRLHFVVAPNCLWRHHFMPPARAPTDSGQLRVLRYGTAWPLLRRGHAVPPLVPGAGRCLPAAPL